MLNATLRLFIGCTTTSIWFEKDNNGVTWQGTPAWILNILKPVMGLNYDVVTGPGNFKPIRKGHADMTIVSQRVTQGKANSFDFSYPLSFNEVYIFSERSDDRVKGNVFKGVFDDTSYCLAAISLATMVLLTILILKKETSHPSIVFTMLHMFGNVFKQGMPPSMTPRSYVGAVWLIFVPTYNMWMCMMYSSIIISMLTVVTETNVINKMVDLNNTENEQVRIIFLNNMNWVQSSFKGANMLTGFENRTDYITSRNNTFITSKLEEEFVLKSILNGSHVFIGTFHQIRDIICRVNRKAGRELVTTHDFRKSTEPLFTNRGGVLIRKKYAHAENIYKAFIWFHALGFWQTWDLAWWYNLDLMRNDGIWAPDEGKCKNRVKKEKCELSIPKMDWNIRTKNIRTRVCLCLQIIPTI